MNTTRRAATEAAKDVEDEARKLGDTVSKVSENVADKAAAVRDAAAEGAGTLRDALAETGDRLAETLRRAADQTGLSDLQENVTAAISDGVNSTVEALRDRSLSDLGADLHEAARRHPGVFILGAAVVGFALGRLMQSAPGPRR